LTNDPPPNDTSKTKKNPLDRRGDPTRQTRISPLHLDYPSNYSLDYRLKEDMEGYEIYERNTCLPRRVSTPIVGIFLGFRRVIGWWIIRQGRKHQGVRSPFELLHVFYCSLWAGVKK
ncbi:MAG: hypothetical protein AAFY70_09990, partial [Bacteroidota bacterium]